MAMVASEVFGSFGNGSDFDLNGLDALITELRTMAKDKRAEMKDVLKAQKDAEKENKSEVGKEYYSKLNIGDEFKIIIGGKEVEVVKIETKSKSNSSAACMIKNWNGEGKSPNRYLGFDKVVVETIEE